MIAILAAAALTLTRVGDAVAFGGKAVRAGHEFLAEDDENAYAIQDPDKPLPLPKDAETIADDPKACRGARAESDIATAPGEIVAAIAHGNVDGVDDATIALVRAKPADDLMGYSMFRLEVWQGKTRVAAADVRDDAYPCAVVLDGNRIGIAWMSLGGGYTAGVTVFDAK